MGKKRDRVEKAAIVRAVLRSGGHSRTELEGKETADLYALRKASLERMLRELDELRKQSGGELPRGERGYYAYYTDELQLLEAGKWLRECMGVALAAEVVDVFDQMKASEQHSKRKSAIEIFIRSVSNDPSLGAVRGTFPKDRRASSRSSGDAEFAQKKRHKSADDNRDFR